MNTVPFTLAEVYRGLATCHGLIRDEGDHLGLEFQVQDSVLGIIKSGVKQVRIPLADLASVTLRRKWFGLSTNLVIQLSRMECVQDVPGMSQGQLVLGIAQGPGSGREIRGRSSCTGRGLKRVPSGRFGQDSCRQCAPERGSARVWVNS